MAGQPLEAENKRGQRQIVETDEKIVGTVERRPAAGREKGSLE